MSGLCFCVRNYGRRTEIWQYRRPMNFVIKYTGKMYTLISSIEPAKDWLYGT
ncbi:hypothetical protein Mapa_011974 [Marchantia paleacea]|nr:hypothetical protein Mapa_011974 [Marchantia paleacea]